MQTSLVHADTSAHARFAPLRATRRIRPARALCAALLVTLVGCSSPPADEAAGLDTPTATPQTACTTGAAVDHRNTSLPVDVTPRPGPAALYAQPGSAPHLENAGSWTAPPILISGAQAYRCGEFLYQDWLFDDHGAAGVLDPQDPQEASAYLFSPKAGTLTYPTDPLYANNAADLVEFRVKPTDAATLFRVTLNTLLDPERVAFTLALGESESAMEWPHSAGVTSPATLFMTVHGETAELMDAASGEPITPAPAVTVDTDRRQITVSVPTAAWNPGTQTIRMALGVGLWDAENSGYVQPSVTASATVPGGAAPGGSALFNMAFRGDEPIPEFQAGAGRTIVDAAVDARLQGRWWRERNQADALAAGDATPFHANVDFAKLRQRVDDDSQVPETGFMNRIMASRYVFGDGVDYTRECGGVSAARPCDGAMVGHLQPYAIYVPEQEPGPDGYGLTLLLHALSANYNQYLGTRHARQLGDRATGTLVVTPAGRGPDGFYFDVAEADVFEVWADVARHYRLDPDWTVMSGVSMGGIGTYRLAPRYPDLFARLMPIVAGAGDYEDLLPSLRNVPLTMWSSTLDELQPITTTEASVTALTDLSYRFDALRFETWDHLTPSTNDDYAPGVDFLGDARIDRDPVRITYVVDAAEDDPRVDVAADQAYWLSDLQQRDPSLGPGTIDVVSEGFGRVQGAPLAVEISTGVLTGGNHEPAPFTRRVLAWAPPETAPAADRLRIQAENIAAVTIHPSRARVSCSAELVIESDGPMEVTLAGCPLQ